jgi:excinuclease ABC subunit C
MNMVLDLIKQLYKLRNCNLKLTDSTIKSNKFKVCLEYHIGNCKAPCIGKETEKEYDQTILEIKEIIKGNISTVARHLKLLLQQYIEKMDFENAQIIKEPYYK